MNRLPMLRRRRVRGTSTLGAFGLAAALLLPQCSPQCAPATPAPGGIEASQLPADVAAVVDLTNQRRAEHHLAPLTIDGAAVAAAQAHAADQAGQQRMSHTGSDGSSAGDRLTRAGYAWRAWAENVAFGYPDAASVMSAWMDSPGHRDNILDADVTEIGVGLAPAGDGTLYWAMVLARPR